MLSCCCNWPVLRGESCCPLDASAASTQTQPQCNNINPRPRARRHAPHFHWDLTPRSLQASGLTTDRMILMHPTPTVACREVSTPPPYFIGHFFSSSKREENRQSSRVHHFVVKTLSALQWSLSADSAHSAVPALTLQCLSIDSAL